MKEELLALLKEYLKVEVETKGGYYGSPRTIEVTIKFGEEIVSESSDTIPEK